MSSMNNKKHKASHHPTDSTTPPASFSAADVANLRTAVALAIVRQRVLQKQPQQPEKRQRLGASQTNKRTRDGSPGDTEDAATFTTSTTRPSFPSPATTVTVASRHHAATDTRKHLTTLMTTAVHLASTSESSPQYHSQGHANVTLPLGLMIHLARVWQHAPADLAASLLHDLLWQQVQSTERNDTTTMSTASSWNTVWKALLAASPPSSRLFHDLARVLKHFFTVHPLWTANMPSSSSSSYALDSLVPLVDLWRMCHQRCGNDGSSLDRPMVVDSTAPTLPAVGLFPADLYPQYTALGRQAYSPRSHIHRGATPSVWSSDPATLVDALWMRHVVGTAVAATAVPSGQGRHFG